MSDELNRRASDKIDTTLEKLMLESSTPQERMMYSVMQSMHSNSLDTQSAVAAMTGAVKVMQESLEAHKKDFFEHANQEQQIMHTIKFTWKLAGGMVAGIQIIVGIAVTQAYGEYAALTERLVTIQKWQADHRVHHILEENGKVVRMDLLTK